MEKRFLIVMGLTLVVIGGFLLYATYPLLAGKETQLKLRPVDPTDILRGEYLVLSYEISQFNDSLPTDGPFRTGDIIYVQLSEESISRAIGYSHRSPEGFFIKGEVDNSGIIYGIERFFIPEGSGQRLDPRDHTVKVKIDGGGNARLVDILLNGEKVNFTYRRINE